MDEYGMGVYIPMYQKVTKKADNLQKEYFHNIQIVYIIET